MADALVLGTSTARCVGSNPSIPTSETVMQWTKNKSWIAIVILVLYLTVGQVIGVWLAAWATQSIKQSIQTMTGQ